MAADKPNRELATGSFLPGLEPAPEPVVEGTVAEVAVPLPIFQTFTYSVPASMCDGLLPGCRVLVPFGPRLVVGLAMQVERQLCPEGIRPVQRVLDEKPVVTPETLQLARWVASHYLAPPGEVIRAMLPPGLLSRKVAEGDAGTSGSFWPTRRRLALVAVLSPPAGLTPRQQQVLEAVQERELPLAVQTLLAEAGITRAVLKSLAAKGAIRLESVETRRPAASHFELPTVVRKHTLTAVQQRIFDRIQQVLQGGGFHRILIHGVTGSGKTEIYLNAIAKVLGAGRTALTLVPEIGLTPQIAHSFRLWFGSEVAILHSGLSARERFDEWKRIREGRAQVVVGTRSAVFAPLPRLGIVIVDEEQDSSYKQEELPRYHAREVARKRAEIEGALLILGSATPQLETFVQSTRKGDPEYLALEQRILGRPLPEVEVVDMREEFQRQGGGTVISERLKQAIGSRLERREQALILLNRRGYSSALLCRSCGATEVCDSCSISLTYHQDSNRLVCHYCGRLRSVPRKCRSCGREYIYYLGHGTQKVQEMVGKLFPNAVVDRMDRDSVQGKNSFERILGAFASGRTNILIGTQMIAKGHDFPRVTLVGVLAAEQGLKLADFRAAERTFQLLTQVAGRAGRGDHPGEVIIQTYYPNHYSLRAARLQDYRQFVEQELRFRKHFQYPPFSFLANLRVNGKTPQASRGLAELVVELLHDQRNRCPQPDRTRVLGPAQAPLEKLKGEYRFQILVKCRSRDELRRILEGVVEGLRFRRQSLKSISIDMDPLNLL